MNLLASLLLVVAAAAPIHELTYASPPASAKPSLAQHKLTRFAAGARLFTASDEVNLRSAAGPDAQVATKLPFGSVVEVLERGERDTVGSRVDHWYLVSALGPARASPVQGYLFGSTLTPFLARGSLDDDGALEAASASWSWRHAVTLRVFDDGAEAARAEWRPGAGWRGGRITKLTAHAKSATGVPLLEVEVLIGDPDDEYKTYWRVFYAYRRPEVGPATLDEVFSAYRNNDVATRVRFHPEAKSAEVQFLHNDVVTKSDRYALAAPAAPAAPLIVLPEQPECFVHVEELPPLLPSSKRTLERQHVVESQPLARGGRILVRHGGCVHYTQVWTLVLPKIPVSVEARLRAAQTALAPFEGAGPILEALGRTLEARSFDERGSFPCADAVCAIESDVLDGEPVLIVSYDVAL